MNQKIMDIAGRRCMLFQNGSGGPALYWGVSAQRREAAQRTAELLYAQAKDSAWLLVAYETEDWNREFSPWPAPAVFGKEAFAGEGRRTLDWLTGECVPYVEAHEAVDGRRRVIGGYSLAGLFSLWAFYESGAFCGAASCSGSLWYPGWEAYAGEKSAPEGSCVYLSLGDREEHTRSRAMAAVGEATRGQLARLEADTSVRACTLVMNHGGHFSDADARMAKGFAWVMGQMCGA